MTRFLTVPGVVALAILVASAARADTMVDFSVDGNGNTIVAGQIIDNEFSALGLNITADNFNQPSNLDWAIAFDSANPTGGDGDLATPGTVGNAVGASLGNLLILSEQTGLDGNGNVSVPDDVGSNPAGIVKFKWDYDITSLGFHLVDIENNVFETQLGYFLSLYNNGVAVGQLSFAALKTRDNSIVYGNNSVNWISPITAAELGVTAFDEVWIGFGGSGAVDSLVWQPVPEPGSLALLSLGVAGGLAVRRRRKKAAA